MVYQPQYTYIINSEEAVNRFYQPHADKPTVNSTLSWWNIAVRFDRSEGGYS